MSDGKSTAWNVLGDMVLCKVSGQESGGHVAVFDVTTPAGHGPPPHVHGREDETFYVLEGVFEFSSQGRTVRVEAGGAFFAPRKVPHSFRNAGPRDGRMLLVATPAGLEHFFEELDKEIGGRPPEMPALIKVLGRHGIELVGPPPA